MYAKGAKFSRPLLFYRHFGELNGGNYFAAESHFLNSSADMLSSGKK